jgi:hypothetical protein
VTFTKIQNYIKKYIGEAEPQEIPRKSRKAAVGLIREGVLEARNGGVAFAPDASEADEEAPEREVVRAQPEKRRKVVLDERASGNLVHITSSGRFVLRRY